MTTATLRPNGFDVLPDSFVGGASPTYQTLTDDSDATYFVDDDVDDAPEVLARMTTVTLPAGSVTKFVRLRWRGSANTADGSDTKCTMRTGSTVLSSLERFSTDTSPTTYTAPYVAATLTQSQVDALTLGWKATTYLGAYRVHEAYIDVVYVEQPVVAVDAVSPDPYTASSEVPISWVNTLDTNGNAQTYYQVRVFDSATYGGVGFDPITSTPFWFEGPASSATSTTTGVLPNGTYRAYVRVAQTVNGVRHWSAWDYDEFTVTVSDAEVDTVTPVADNANGLIQVTVARDTATEAWEYIEVQRSTDSGSTWEYVRGAAYVDATGSADSFVVDDYEVGNGQTVKYRARATRIVSGLMIVGSWVESASTTSWSSDATWIKDPNDPSKNLAVSLRRVPTEGVAARQGVFNVIGSAYPIVVSDARSATSGTIAVAIETIADVASMRSLLQSPVWLVNAPATKDLGFEYIAPGNAERVREARTVIRQETWVVDFNEVAAPADPTAGV